ncbi:MAG TPA: thiamine pyrophosphate-binding protein, partial [Salinimicrobium sp.]|nr:thiamine pyrophosphate-binding protein [Salinimicrobium sp.]
FCLNKHFEVEPNHFFDTFLKLTKPLESEYRKKWIGVKQKRQELHQKYLEKIPFSDLKVFRMILKAVPKNYMIHFSNSSAIRYAQLFDLDRSYKIYCNRGTSGIDGSTSTAIGAASLKKDPAVVITGDLAFFYDSNGLWNNYIPANFKIIMINNGGGGIFRILPGNKNSENFEQFIETTHNLNAKALSDMHGFNYHIASQEEDLEKVLNKFYTENEQPAILEIFTPRKLNDNVLLEYFRYIRGEE